MKKVLSIPLTVLLYISFCGCESISTFYSNWWSEKPSLWPGETAAQASAGENGGTQSVRMPQCEGKTKTEAHEALAELGINVEFVFAYSETADENFVISQSVEAGSVVEADQLVTVVVSLGRDESPYGYSQKLVVSAPAGSSYAQAAFCEWENGQWCERAVYSATVGKNGIGPGQEGSRRTPSGIHKLGVILSSASLQTNLSTYRATSNTSVVNETTSSYYNMIMEESEVPGGTSFDRIGKSLCNGTTYAMIYIEHNGSGFSSENVVAGGGSAMGVRGQYGALAPTYGDVDISYADMLDLISRLDVNKNPMIEIVVS